MPREISLDGGEISIVKALGFAGGGVSGKTLRDRVSELEDAELFDTVRSLMDIGYVVSDKSGFHTSEEFEKANFHVNSGYARDLKESLNPTREKPKSRRIRRE